MKKLMLNNFKIRTKLLLIYGFCVLLPLVLTDAIVLLSISQSSKNAQRTTIEYAVERIEYNLSETVNGSILFTSNLYLDQNLNEFLSKHYKSDLEYFNEYYKFIQNSNLNFNYNYGLLYKISIFADNDTIINGGSIATLDMIKKEDWYKAFKQSGEDKFLYAYFDQEKAFLPGSGFSRTISIIRSLNNFGNDGIEKIIKIDLDYNLMYQDVLNEKVEGEIYVRNDKYILFTNVANRYTNKLYDAANSIDENEIYLSKSFQTCNQVWEIVVISQELPFWNSIVQSKGLIALVLLNLIFPTILIYFVGRSISKRLSVIATYMGKVKKEQFEVIEGKEGEDEIGNLIRSYNLMVLRIKDLIEVVFKRNAEKQDLELSKKQAELQAIQSQVNPHFLFNTLETIRMRSLLKKENETADIIGELALLFRRNMDWSSDIISIEEEMNFVNKYISIQKYRFGDRINYYHYVMEECKGCKIPKLSIGTLVENAFIHGLETSSTKGVLSVTITMNTQFLFIEISDNGKGFDKAKLEKLTQLIAIADSKSLYEAKSTGLLNTFLRLKMFSDGQLKFEIESEPNEGTDIIIQLPLSYCGYKPSQNLTQSEEAIKE